MVGRTKHKTRADRERFDKLQEIGCIVSLAYFNRRGVPGDIHHLLTGGRRYPDQHQMTICLEPWYHRGIPPSGFTESQARARLGPTLCHEKRQFVERFGTELDLLEMTNSCIERMQ